MAPLSLGLRAPVSRICLCHSRIRRRRSETGVAIRARPRLPTAGRSTHSIDAVTEEDRRRWDERYTQLGPASPDAVRIPGFLAPHKDLIPTAGHAIDIACGQGLGAIWLAQRGLEVTGLDISGVAIEQARDLAHRSGIGERCQFDTIDLDEGMPLGPAVEFIVCNNFRDPRLNRAMVRRLAPGGLLAIAVRSEVGGAPGRFCAAPGELTTAFNKLNVIAADEGDGAAWLLARS